VKPIRKVEIEVKKMQREEMDARNTDASSLLKL
jgi:hypothetical protein